MNTIALTLGWWVSVVLPVVIGLSLVSMLALPWICRRSWRFQSCVFLGLIVAFQWVLMAPAFPWPEKVVERSVASLAVGSPVVLADVPIDEVRDSRWSYELLALLGAIWVAGALVCLTRLGLSKWALRKLVRQASVMGDEALEANFGSAMRGRVMREKIEVLLTEEEVSPCCLGWRHRKVLVPQSMLQWLKPIERNLVLLHEALHLSAGDVPLLYFQRVIEALYWWNPIVKKLSDGLSEAREGLCDGALVARGIERQAYAHLLVQLSESSSPQMSPAVAGSPRYKGLKLRLERILSGKPPSRRQAWYGGVLALGVYVSVVLAVIFVRGTMPQPVSSLAKEGVLKDSDLPELTLVSALLNDERMVYFKEGYLLKVGDTKTVETGLQLSYLGVFKDKVHVRWSSANGDLVQEFEKPHATTPLGFRLVSEPRIPVRRMEYDDADFSRRHVHQGFEELKQQVPGQLQHEVSQDL